MAVAVYSTLLPVYEGLLCVESEEMDDVRLDEFRWRVAKGAHFVASGSANSAWVIETRRPDFTLERMYERCFKEGWHLNRGEWVTGWSGPFFDFARAVYYLGTGDLAANEYDLVFAYHGLDIEPEVRGTEREREFQMLRILWHAAGKNYAKRYRWVPGE